jgi:hypothetical protein
MGIKQVIVDDFDGLTELPEGTEPQEVTFGGKKYKVYLSAANAERFVDFLSGKAPLSTSPGDPARTSNSTDGGSRVKTNTYGHDYAEVKAWAIANGIKAANGNPVTEKTPRIGQSIYDAFHKQHKRK